MKKGVLFARIVFGLWMVLNGVNYLFVSLWSMPAGQEPLAIQLMAALVNSRLLDVAMAMQLAGGVLILANVALPAALAALMPITVCALFWAVVLNHQPLYILLTLLALALNGGLMLAWLPSYRDVLGFRPLALGETAAHDRHYEALFVNPGGQSSRGTFIPAVVTVVAAMAFFYFQVTGRTAQFCMLILLYPFFILLARRLRDMGQRVGILAVPLILAIAAFAVMLDYLSPGEAAARGLQWAAVIICTGFIVWGSLHPGRAQQ